MSAATLSMWTSTSMIGRQSREATAARKAECAEKIQTFAHFAANPTQRWEYSQCIAEFYRPPDQNPPGAPAAFFGVLACFGMLVWALCWLITHYPRSARR